MSAQTDTVIAGAGIAGLTLAVLLARAGQLVTVSGDDPEYGLAVNYRVKTGSLSGGH